MNPAAPQHERRIGLFARLAKLVQRLVVLAVVGVAAFVAAKHYGFDRLDEEIRDHCECKLQSQYPGLFVSVESARRVAGRGVEIRGVRIAEAGEEASVLVEIDEVFAECDTRLPDFLTRQPRPTAVAIRGLKLRAERKASGRWNVAHLLPLPTCEGRSPRITIAGASIEIIDQGQEPACSWTLRDIELAVEPAAAAEGQPAGQRGPLKLAGTLAGDHLERVELAGRVDPTTGAWDMRGAVEGLEFSPRLRAALPRELSERLAPLASIRGRTHFGFHIEQAADDAGEPGEPPIQFVVHGKIDEGRIDDDRLPEPLTDVAATIRCDNHGVLIQNLSAHCGGTEIELSASVVGYTGRGPLELDLVARKLQLDRLRIDALPAGVAEAWLRFQPRGLVDVRGRVTFDGQHWRPDLTFQCHDLSLAYDRFPYRLTGGNGTIALRPDSMSVRLAAIGGGRPIHCRAEVQRPGPDFTGWIDVQSEGSIPIDDKLLAAMNADTLRIVRAFRPRGAASFQARFHREPGEETVHRTIAIRLADCSIQHERFPYPIDKVSGSLELTDDTWLFRNLAGRNDSASIEGAGSWTCGDEKQGRLALQFTATDVPLADELQQALPAGPQRLWANLRPRGNIDHLVVGLNYASAERAWSIDVKAEKWERAGSGGRSITLEPAWFPYRLDNLTGNFHYRDGLMQLTRLRASHGGARLSAEGSSRVLPDGGCQLDFTRLAADHLEIDRDFLTALPAGLGQTLGRFAVTGPLNGIGTLGITVPPEAGTPPQLQWKLSLDIENGRIAAATPIEHLFGGMQLAGRLGPDGFFSRGELAVDSAMVRGVQLTRIAGPFWLDGQRLVFGTLAERDAQGRVPRQVTAQVFGGQLAVDGEVSLAGDGAFEVQPTLEGADLATIARELAPHQRGLSGNVFGLARITGNAQGKHTWRGDGQVRLTDADVYELPAMVALLKLLNVQRPDRTAFTTSSIDFRVEGDDLALDRIDFSGDAISLKGRGRMNAQRHVDLKFYPVFGREEHQLPIFRPLLGETGREFMLIEVTGPLDRPDVRQTVFPRIDARLQALFPELARDELVEPVVPILQRSRQALDPLRLLPWR